MTQHQITDAAYAAALAAGQTEAETEVRAQAVRYVPERDAVEIVTTRNAGFRIPGRQAAWRHLGPDGRCNNAGMHRVDPDAIAHLGAV